MVRLKQRNQIPDGIVFRQPETNFSTRPHSSFRGMVEAVISHRKANPEHTRIHGWSTDRDQVAAEIDSYLAVACQTMGWNQFIMEGSAASPRPVPSSRLASLRRGVSASVVGAETLVVWLKSGAEAVPEPQANARAAVCVRCPKHGKGDWTAIFTRPASEAIRVAVEQRKEWKLSTEFDDELNICEACNCPMKLKVHMPLDQIRAKMKPEVWESLPGDICWMKKEAAGA